MCEYNSQSGSMSIVSKVVCALNMPISLAISSAKGARVILYVYQNKGGVVPPSQISLSASQRDRTSESHVHIISLPLFHKKT